MTRILIDNSLWLSEQAYQADKGQSLLGNLRHLSVEDWTALPPGAGRSIAEILEHVGWAKWMYQDYAFGLATLRGDLPPMVPDAGLTSRPQQELLEWIDQGHRRWLASVAALSDDSDLDRLCSTNWGELLPARDLVSMLIGHDYYHAGEINHLRALLQGNDRWPY